MSGNIHVIKVPDVGEGIAEVELVAWHVKVGDAVTEDQPLADVMTDKASVEIPSPVAGHVQALGGDLGETLAVGSELMRIQVAGEVDGTSEGSEVAATHVSASAASPPPAPKPASAPTMAKPAPAPSMPTPKTSPSPGLAGDARPVPALDNRPIASPALRRRAWELGVDLRDVAPSGSAGRIMQADLDAHVAAHGARLPPATVPAHASGAERTDTQEVKVIGVRRRIAVQMQEAKRRIPHFSYVEEIDVTELEALRAALNVKWAGERGKLTLLPLLMRALIVAVRDYPQINALFDDDQGIVTRHGAVHIGIATQTPHGLMVPVVRHAEAHSIWAMADEVQRLADAARAGRATRAEMSGSTITISSLGALGGIVSTPVINRPEVAIVAVNRIVERPMMRNGAVVARQMMNLSSSFDHRVVDGIDAAQFVQALRMLLETPALLFAE